MLSPLIGVTCCIQVLDAPHHSVFEKYIDAVTNGIKGTPVLLPAIGSSTNIDTMIDKLDGLLLTGSPSNVEPYHFNEAPVNDAIEYDPLRDATTLPLILKAIENDLPVFGICRGLQEINVALGGSLHQEIEESIDVIHRVIPNDVMSEKFIPKHELCIDESSWFFNMLKRYDLDKNEIKVNSLHRQGIKKVAADLSIEATSKDNIIEMVKLKRDDRFLLAVQWHPEWFLDTTPLHIALFNEFSEACKHRMS